MVLGYLEMYLAGLEIAGEDVSFPVPLKQRPQTQWLEQHVSVLRALEI